MFLIHCPPVCLLLPLILPFVQSSSCSSLVWFRLWLINCLLSCFLFLLILSVLSLFLLSSFLRTYSPTSRKCYLRSPYPSLEQLKIHRQKGMRAERFAASRSCNVTALQLLLGPSPSKEKLRAFVKFAQKNATICRGGHAKIAILLAWQRAHFQPRANIEKNCHPGKGHRTPLQVLDHRPPTLGSRALTLLRILSAPKS